MKQYAILFLVLGILLASFATANQQLDFLNVKENSSNDGFFWWLQHDVCTDHPIWTFIPFSGIRCECQGEEMMFTMHTDETAKEIELRYLNLTASEGYEMYVKVGAHWIQLTKSSTTDPLVTAAGTWNTDHYVFANTTGVPATLTGSIQFKVVLTTTERAACTIVGWTKLVGEEDNNNGNNNDNDVPEFGTFAAGLAVLGAVSGLYLLRKRE